MSSSMNDVVVGKYYQAKYKIGSGSFGEIYLGIDLRTSEKVSAHTRVAWTRSHPLLPPSSSSHSHPLPLPLSVVSAP